MLVPCTVQSDLRKLRLLAQFVETHSDEVYRVVGLLEQAGFRSRTDISTADNTGVDPNWHVSYNAGDTGRAGAIRVDGVDHLPMDAGRTVVDTLKSAVNEVGRKFSYLNNLPVKYESSLHNRLQA